MGKEEKRAYTTPSIQEWGTVQELTQTGQTNPGNDAKEGSVASQGV
jgi:hypothetical protein